MPTYDREEAGWAAANAGATLEREVRLMTDNTKNTKAKQRRSATMEEPRKTYLPGMGHDWMLPLYDPLQKLLGFDPDPKNAKSRIHERPKRSRRVRRRSHSPDRHRHNHRLLRAGLRDRLPLPHKGEPRDA